MADIHPGAFAVHAMRKGLPALWETLEDDEDVFRLDKLNSHPEVQKVILETLVAEQLIDSKRMNEAFGFSSSQASVFMTIWWAWMCWNRCRQQIYSVSPGLADVIRFSSAMVDKVKSEDFILPHRALYIRLPRWWTLENPVTGTHHVDGMYMIDSIQAFEHMRDYTGVGTDRWVICMITCGPGSRMIGTEMEPYDDEISTLPLCLPAGRTLGEAFERARAATAMRLTTKEIGQEGTVEDIIRFAFGAMVYATSANAELTVRVAHLYRKLQRIMEKEPKGSSKYKRAEDKLKHLYTRRSIEMGSSVQKTKPTEDSKRKKVRFVCSHEQTYWVKIDNIPPSVSGERKYLAVRTNEIGTQLYKIRKYKIGGWYGLEDGADPPPPDGREHRLS